MLNGSADPQDNIHIVHQICADLENYVLGRTTALTLEFTRQKTNYFIFTALTAYMAQFIRRVAVDPMKMASGLGDALVELVSISQQGRSGVNDYGKQIKQMDSGSNKETGGSPQRVKSAGRKKDTSKKAS